jgi:hypothetical protein
MQDEIEEEENKFSDVYGKFIPNKGETKDEEFKIEVSQ